MIQARYRRMLNFSKKIGQIMCACTLLTLFLCTNWVSGLPVPQQVADRIAQDWGYVHGWHLERAGWTPASEEQEPQVTFVGTLVDNAGQVAAYQYQLPSGGQVVIVNEDQLNPIFYFSETNSFDPDAHPTARYLFDVLIGSIECARSNSGGPPSPAWTSIANRADSFRSQQAQSQYLAQSIVGPLIQTQWGQGNPYNLFCPEYEDERSVVGCTATAMAQILKYWEYPNQLVPRIIQYTTQSFEIPVGPVDVGSRPFDWQNMPLRATNQSTQRQKDAVAWLSYVCGLTVEMDYSPYGSGAWTVLPPEFPWPTAERALRDIFGYDEASGFFRYDVQYWEELMIDQVSRGMPILYTGYDASSGHAFILDGYRGNDQGYLFHINMGWNGICDGWYSLNVFDECMPFIYDQSAIINVGTGYRLTTRISPEFAGAIITNPIRSFHTPNSTISILAQPNPGYVFERWEGSITGSVNPATLLMNREKTVTAIFSPGYRLNLQKDGRGTVGSDPVGHTQRPGTHVSISAYPEPGWMFDHWRGDISGNDNPVSIEMTNHKRVRAVFAQKNNLLTVCTGEGQVVRNPDHVNYVPGQRVILRAAPQEGWEFRKWWGDIDSTSNPAAIVMTGDKIVQAEFVKIGAVDDMPLSIARVGQGQVFPFGGSFTKNSMVTLTAIPADGWRLYQWRGDVETITNDNPITVKMDKARSINAVFLESDAQSPAGAVTHIQDLLAAHGVDFRADAPPENLKAAKDDEDLDPSNLNLIGGCMPWAIMVMLSAVFSFSILKQDDDS